MKTTMTHSFKTLIPLAALFLAASPALALAADTTTAAANTAAGVSAGANVGASAGANIDARTDVPAGVSARATAEVSRLQGRANREIDRRTVNLNELLARVQDIKNLSAADKTSVGATITNQINAFAQLKAKIGADTDLATLKTDVRSITDSYRIYALVLPQIRIIIAADRVVTAAREMQLFSAKLQSRVSAAESAGADMTAASGALADFNAKVSDAGASAQAAVTAIANLAPDQGDKAKMAANTAALKDARAKIVAAQKDIAAARRDAASVVSAVKGKPIAPPVSASASATSSVQSSAPAPRQ